MKHLHLLIDGLFPDFGPQTEALAGVHPPAGVRAIQRLGRPLQPARAGFSRVLADALGEDADFEFPWGGVLAAQAGLDVGQGQWFCADPVHLILMLDHLRLGGREDLLISADEAETLVAQLNRHFAGDLTLFAARPERWFVQVGDPLAVRTVPVSEAAGGSVLPLLPKGRDGRRLQTWMNEVQMLLHDHPINVAREARSLRAINSVWLWGGGQIGWRPSHPATLKLFSDAELAQAGGSAGWLAVRPLPAGFSGVSESGRQDIHLHLDALDLPARHGDIDHWLDRAAALERDWFQPVLAALRWGRLRSLTVEALGSGQPCRRLGWRDAWRARLSP